MNIFMHEFKMKIKSIVIWSLSITALIFMYMGVFSSMAVDAAIMNQMLANFPEEFLIAFGMDNMDWSTIMGFFGVVFLFAQICLSIQAANYGFSLVSVEERDMTADFLLAKPVSRTKILSIKLLAAFSALTITNLLVWGSSLGAIETFQTEAGYVLENVILLLSSIVIFQLFFLSVGLLISLLVKRVRSVTPYSMGLAFGTYIVSAFGGMIGDDKLELVSPFRHFEPNYILKNGEFELSLVMISVVVIIVSVVGSYMLYAKRNIHSAT